MFILSAPGSIRSHGALCSPWLAAMSDMYVCITFRVIESGTKLITLCRFWSKWIWLLSMQKRWCLVRVHYNNLRSTVLSLIQEGSRLSLLDSFFWMVLSSIRPLTILSLLSIVVGPMTTCRHLHEWKSLQSDWLDSNESNESNQWIWF